MLRLNNFKQDVLKNYSYLNTSHVKVKLLLQVIRWKFMSNLNTSHVKVKPNKPTYISKSDNSFKYISC